MKAIELIMSDEVYKKLENLASQDHLSVNAQSHFACDTLVSSNCHFPQARFAALVPNKGA